METCIHSGRWIAYTDKHGNFKIGGLSEAFSYVVRARNPMIETPTEMIEDLRYARRLSEGKTGGNVKADVRVMTGSATRGIHLVLAPPTRIYGKVTDSSSGKPFHPLRVSVKPGNAFTTTNPDGSYSLVAEVDRPAGFRLQWQYEYFNGAGHSGSVENAFLDIAPGEEKEFDFAVSGPITIPALFVDESGRPCSDFFPGLAYVGQLRSQDEKVGDDGRVVLRGLPPDYTYEVLAVRNPGFHIVGRSEPITAQPGETVREITVVCSADYVEGSSVRPAR
ncbi:hypothetical protein ACFL1X_03210 [Candidatus Hydrogenedentota bacterium]